MAIKTFPDQIVSQLCLRVSGPGGPDVTDLRVAGSPGNPGVFRATNNNDVPMEIQRVIGLVRTSSPGQLDQFGNLAALTNGVLVQFVDDQGSVTLDLTASTPMRRNTDFWYLTGDAEVLTIGSKTAIPVYYEAHTDDGLAVPPGHSFQIVVQDDLTGLTEFRVAVTGRVEATSSFATASR